MRRHDPFDKKSAAFSVGLHVALLLLAWASTLYSAPEMEFIAYEIELVSPPSVEQAEEAAPAVEEMTVEQPDPTPPEPEPDQEEVQVEQEDPEPPKPDPEPVTEVADDPTPSTTTEEPEEDTQESGEDLNVRLEGVRRDYPAYYDNIIRQIFNCFRPPQAGNWEATIVFNIQRDGTVSDMDFVTRSGNVEFDFAAMGAIECAGGGRFGPLPEELPFDRLPIQFDFKPSRELMRLTVVGGRPAVH